MKALPQGTKEFKQRPVEAFVEEQRDQKAQNDR
jgi:hypothetical protein